MKKGEYRISCYWLQDSVREGKTAQAAFHCDQRGQCFVHDLSREAADRVLDILNDEGRKGREWVQWGTHPDELICHRKRALG